MVTMAGGQLHLWPVDNYYIWLENGYINCLGQNNRGAVTQWCKIGTISSDNQQWMVDEGQ